MRDKTIYQEKYKKGSAMYSDDRLPQFNHLPETVVVDSAELKESGIIDRHGERLEYQVIKVIFKVIKP